jgi:hypothetical protein
MMQIAQNMQRTAASEVCLELARMNKRMCGFTFLCSKRLLMSFYGV